MEAYAAAHPKETNGALARLALGVAAYEQKDYPGAVAACGRSPASCRDCRLRLLLPGRRAGGIEDMEGVTKDLAPVHAGDLRRRSGRAWVLQARAFRRRRPAEAVRLLREHYAELPQPDGDLTLADSYQAAGDRAHAADFYQRSSPNTSRATSPRAPPPPGDAEGRHGRGLSAAAGQQLLQRADRLLDARLMRQARAEFQSLAGQLTGLDRDQAPVRVGAADFLHGNTPPPALIYAASIWANPEADAERLSLPGGMRPPAHDEDDMLQALERLGERYPHSPWRLKASSRPPTGSWWSTGPAITCRCTRPSTRIFPTIRMRLGATGR